jgi:uncharacterized protein YodC (DUF2158 family)
MAQELKIGDVVQLNSGGPKMTVAGLQSDGAVRCVWFSPDAEFSRQTRYAPLRGRNSPRMADAPPRSKTDCGHNFEVAHDHRGFFL